MFHKTFDYSILAILGKNSYRNDLIKFQNFKQFIGYHPKSPSKYAKVLPTYQYFQVYWHVRGWIKAKRYYYNWLEAILKPFNESILLFLPTVFREVRRQKIVTVCDFNVLLFMNLFPKFLIVVRKTALFQTCKVLRTF